MDGTVTAAHGARLVLRGGDGETEAAAEEKEAPAAEEKKGFVLDDWKRLYSNTEDTKSIMGQFWEMYDKEVRFLVALAMLSWMLLKAGSGRKHNTVALHTFDGPTRTCAFA